MNIEIPYTDYPLESVLEMPPPRPLGVAPLGFEPRHTEPESAVLPLHNRAGKIHAAKIKK